MDQPAKLTLYYDFDDVYREGKDSMRVTVKDFPYTIVIRHSELLKSIIDFYDKYREDALREAAYSYMSDLGEFIANAND